MHIRTSLGFTTVSSEFAHGTGAVPTKAEPDESAQSPTIPKPSATMDGVGIIGKEGRRKPRTKRSGDVAMN